ncbi:kinase-like protein [Clavulina sp. PMI_390]|nr:kinase-like protein [Clavulina sp. PMI_390]
MTSLKSIRREIVSQIQIHHPHVLPILGISTDKVHPLSIITPIAPKGNAFRYLTMLDSSKRGAAMLEIVRSYVSDITSALCYLHQLRPPIIHGDLHARNILIDINGKGILCDFGLSRFKHEVTRTATNITEGGKYRYMAPELLSSSPRHKFRTTPASDCYAFAMTILELATLKKPFAEFNNEQAAFSAAQTGIRPERPTWRTFGSLSEQRVDMLWDLLKQMWDENPSNRPSMYHVDFCLVEIWSIVQ